MTDRELIEWVANVRSGDALPPGYGSDQTVVQQLVRLGVQEEPPIGAPLVQVLDDAQRAARAWLSEH